MGGPDEPSGTGDMEPPQSEEAPPGQERPPGQELAGDALEGADLGRRRFFRQFMAEAVQAAASVVGAANALQRSSSEAAGSLLGLGGPAVPAEATLPPFPVEQPFVPAPRAGFRSPFRMEEDHLVLLDQRRFPDEVVELRCSSAAEVAAAIRDRRVEGSGTIAQAAAYGLCLTADRGRTSTAYARRAVLRASAQVLREAAPIEMLLRRAIDRLLAGWEEVGDLAEDGDAVADRLRAEADALALEAPIANARLATAGAAIVPGAADQRLGVLTLGETGPLASGLVGTAFGVMRELANTGRSVEVYVAETRPPLWGSRLTAWELAQAGIPHTVVADAAIGWLMAEGRIDAVLVGASRIAMDGGTAATIGTYPAAVLAARHGVPFYVCASLATVDPLAPSGAAFSSVLRDPDEVTSPDGRRVAPSGTAALNPAFDVTPGELVTAVITEAGALGPPYAATFGPALEAAGLLVSAAPAATGGGGG